MSCIDRESVAVIRLEVGKDCSFFLTELTFVLFCRCKRWNEQDKDLAKSRGVLASTVLKRDAKVEGEKRGLGG